MSLQSGNDTKPSLDALSFSSSPVHGTATLRSARWVETSLQLTCEISGYKTDGDLSFGVKEEPYRANRLLPHVELLKMTVTYNMVV